LTIIFVHFASLVESSTSHAYILHSEFFQVFWSYWCSERGKTEQKVTLPPTYSITSSREGSSQLSSPSRHFYSIAEETRQSILLDILDRRGE